MVRSPDETEADLEKTDELPALDVASYEEQFSSYSRQTGLSAPVVADTTGDDGGPHPLPVLTPAETLRDIEAWIGAQEARAQAHERVVEELREARRSAQTRADNLAPSSTPHRKPFAQLWVARTTASAPRSPVMPKAGQPSLARRT